MFSLCDIGASVEKVLSNFPRYTIDGCCLGEEGAPSASWDTPVSNVLPVYKRHTVVAQQMDNLFGCVWRSPGLGSGRLFFLADVLLGLDWLR